MTPVTEAELKAKAVAPRVTEVALEANIKSADYFFHGLLTICVLTLQNGFTVVGESACASAENYNADIGSRLAHADAKRKIWALMGYSLREQLFQTEKTTLTADGQLTPSQLLAGRPAVERDPSQGDLFLDESLTMLLAHSRGNALALKPQHADAILDHLAQTTDDTDPSFLVPPKAETFLDRLKAERLELDEKINKLQAFFPTLTFRELPAPERELLIAQNEVMCRYCNILTQRERILEQKQGGR